MITAKIAKEISLCSKSLLLTKCESSIKDSAENGKFDVTVQINDGISHETRKAVAKVLEENGYNVYWCSNTNFMTIKWENA